MSAALRHAQELVKVAARFRAQGYEVLLEPRFEDLPSFLAGTFSPDLLARRGDESLVVEVSGVAKPNLAEAVMRTEAQPGWRFILVVPAAIDGGDAREIPAGGDDIRRRLDAPSRLLSEGEPIAALLLAWSLFEAAARRRFALDGAAEGRALAAGALLRRLVHLGYLGQDAMELDELVRARDRAAHGDLSVAVEPQALARVRALTEELLEEPRAA